MQKISYLPVETMKALEICKATFSCYDEIWSIGIKGDHHYNLLELGVLTNPTIHLAHVHNSLGIKAKYTFTPPTGSGSTLEGMINELHPGIEGHIGRIAQENKHVCVFSPFPNAELERLIEVHDAKDLFTITSPTALVGDFIRIENKIETLRLLEKVILKQDNKTNLLAGLLIPSIVFRPKNMNFSTLKHYFSLDQGQGVYMQKSFSGGGSGTKLVKSQAEIDLLLKDKTWQECAEKDALKASVEIREAYSANGSACIIPDETEGCVVLIDALSHKPVGLKELNGKVSAGIGNDWWSLWPIHIQEQYIASATLIGEELYKQFGYTGIFGPDYLIETLDNGTLNLRLTEINPRWQGTTPYQTANAIINKRIPLEIMHYIVKHDKSGLATRELLTLTDNPKVYNQQSVNSHGCFYIKLGSPEAQKTVRADLNGQYLYTGSQLIGPYENTSSFDALLNNTDDEVLVKDLAMIKKRGDHATLVTIRAPRLGEQVGGGLSPIGYVAGYSDRPIFSPHRPGVTQYGKELYDIITDSLYSISAPITASLEAPMLKVPKS